MKKNQFNKIILSKKAQMTILGTIIFSLVVMFVILFIIPSNLFASTNPVYEYATKLFGSSQPVQKGLNDENITRLSIAALVEGINKAANREYSYSDSNKFEAYPNYAPVNYTVTFHAKVKLKKSPLSMTSDSFKKSFASIFDASVDTYLSEEWFIFTDFRLDADQAKEHNSFYENTKKFHPTITNQAPVEQLNQVYNLELEANYADGSKCVAKTYTGEGLPGDYDLMPPNDLQTWGKWGSVCSSISGCDRNGDGVPGSFSTEKIDGKEDAKTVLGSQWDKVVKNKLENRFPNGRITVDSGEECLDSPTWLECNGLRIYYCGKYGFQSGQSKTLEDKDYFITAYNGTHSRAGIRLLRVFDESFKGESTTSNIKEAIDDSRSDKIGGTNGFASVKRDKFAISYLHDKLISKISKSSTETQNSLISCSEGETVGNSLLKCNMYGCNLCNFELKQKNVDQVDAWMYANLDPQYLIYYQAFPLLEDSAWTSSGLSKISPSSVKLESEYLEKSSQQIADEIKILFQNTFDLNAEKLAEPISTSEEVIYYAFHQSEAFLIFADQTTAKKIFDKASSVADILVADPSASKIESFMKKSNYEPYLSFVKSQPQITSPTIYSFALFFVIREEMNGKLYSLGNSLVIKKPFENPTTSSQFLASSNGLNEEAQKYYLQLGKSNGATSRFYLASPCKTNLKIIRTKCTLSEEEIAQSKVGIKTVDCIEVIPVMDGTVKNFCYNSGVSLARSWWPNYNFVSSESRTTVIS